MSQADVPSFLFIHTALSAILVSSTWYICYVAAGSCAPKPPPTTIMSPLLSSTQQQPPKSILLNALLSSSFVPQSIQKRAYSSLVSIEKASCNSSVVKFVQRTFPSIDATRLVLSFAEAKFGRLFFKPITVPGRIWLSWKGAKAWRCFRERCYAVSSKECMSLSSSLSSLGQSRCSLGGDKIHASLPTSSSSSSCRYVSSLKSSPRSYLVSSSQTRSFPFTCPSLTRTTGPISPFHTPCF
uniref:Uncharacterized protein n=1 Tax=Ditylum brightwellii TaxID=49249 RepID=A0A7S1YV05_9STRA